MESYSKVIQKIKDQKPQVIYLSGKTCTGKTTLAGYLSETLGFGRIELDDVVHNLKAPLTDEQKLIETYRYRNDAALVKEFVALARNQIDKALVDHPAIVFEGALANNETLFEIAAGHEFLFIYLLPVNLDVYLPRIIDRFKRTSPVNKSILPPAFWRHIEPDTLERFYETKAVTPALNDCITAYATESMKDAKARLDMFAQRFENIFVIEV